MRLQNQAHQTSLYRDGTQGGHYTRETHVRCCGEDHGWADHRTWYRTCPGPPPFARLQGVSVLVEVEFFGSQCEFIGKGLWYLLSLAPVGGRGPLAPQSWQSAPKGQLITVPELWPTEPSPPSLHWPLDA